MAGTTGWLRDFSTTYAMGGPYAAVPERARRALGHSVPIVYLLRDPIQRAVSHHHHWVARGMAHPDVDEALRSLRSWKRHSTAGRCNGGSESLAPVASSLLFLRSMWRTAPEWLPRLLHFWVWIHSYSHWVTRSSMPTQVVG